MEESGSLFAPDFLTPSQFADLQRAGNDPIKCLLFAVLELGVRDAVGRDGPKRKKGRNGIMSPTA